jgi:hypothetical protein
MSRSLSPGEDGQKSVHGLVYRGVRSVDEYHYCMNEYEYHSFILCLYDNWVLRVICQDHSHLEETGKEVPMG